MTLYHGTANPEMVLHEGICLTDTEDVARAYATSGGSVTELEIDLDDLRVEECDGFDWDTYGTCPADDPEYRARFREQGVDVLLYEDCDTNCALHECIRLISDKALAAVRILETV